MTWTIPAFGLAMFTAANAVYAWTAIAHHPQQGMAYVYYMAKSADEAEQRAMEGCERQAHGCTLLGRSMDGPMATVLVRGTQGYHRADDVDPNIAENKALQQCRQREHSNFNCKLVSAAWDRGTHIMAIAVDHETAWVGPSSSTEAQAKNIALASCRSASRAAERCAIFHVLNGPGWVSIAQGRQENGLTTGIGLSVRSPAIARSNAIAECETARPAESAEPAECTELLNFHNPAGRSEPAAFRELATRIRADKRVTTASVPPFLGTPKP